MVLFVMKGLWFGTLGIIVMVLGIFGLGGSLGAFVKSEFERRRREREAILYGIGQKRNLLHVLGDLWNRLG